MGDDVVNSMLYAIDQETGEKFVVGKGIKEIPELAPGGIVKETEEISYIGESPAIEIPIIPKTIKKKRFIKLLMAKGYQRNDAYKIHKEYMKTHKMRTQIGLVLRIGGIL